MKKILVYIIGIFSIISKVYAFNFPDLTGQVVDEANILTLEEKNALTTTLKKANPRQVVAVSLLSLEGKEIEEYGVALGRHWGIGNKDSNDGVLVLIAPNQRQLRIEVGYGLESILTDAISSKIVNQIMLPLAKQNKYNEALIHGSEAVVDVLTKGPTTDEKILSDNASNTINKHKNSIGLGKFILYLFLFWLIRFTVPLYIYNRYFKNPNKTPLVEHKTIFTQQEEQEIFKNRLYYIVSNLFIMFLYSIFVIAAISALNENRELTGIIFAIIFIFIHSLTFIKINFFELLKEKYRFTNEEFAKEYLNPKYGLYSYTSGHLHGYSSHGSGSSFSGRGGSFGGGGSSGKW